MRFRPHDYQSKAISWVKSHPRCCLFLEMGLGKTVATLTAVKELIDECEVTRVLVVAPKKVAESTWATEAAKWDHLSALRVVKVMGTESQRVKALGTPADIYVIGRDSFVWLFGQYNGRLPFDTMVLDELTSFKSPKASRTKAMKMASAGVSRVIGLTGTPAPNGLIDLWAQMYCIDLGQRLGRSVTRYRSMYFDEIKWQHITVKCNLKPGAEKAIRDKIADICLTMQAEDYLSLPPLIVSDVPVELPPKVMESYRQFERDRVMEFVEANDMATVTAASAAALMNKLSQWANGAVYDENHEVHDIHTEKLDRLWEIVESASDGVLVFYQYQHDRDRIAASKPKAVKNVCIYQGDEDLQEWNRGDIRVMLAHPASTAYGLNMQQGGHTVVWFGTGWNLELYQQANARLHRQGQAHPVMVYNLVCPGTVDTRAAAAIENKNTVQRALMDNLKDLVKKHRK